MYVRDCGADVFMKLLSTGDHDNGNLGITKNSKLMGFLEKTISPL